MSMSKRIILITVLISLLVLIIAIIPNNFTIKSDNVEVVVLSNSTRLKSGDYIVIEVINIENEDLDVVIEPAEIFETTGKVLNGNSIEVQAIIKANESLRGFLKGKVSLVRGNAIIYEKPFYFILNQEDPLMETEGIIINIHEDYTLSVWHWDIGIPYRAKSKLFIAPMLKNFTLLREYLEYQVYVGRIMYRGGAWWPLRGFGAHVVNKTLDDLFDIRVENSLILLNITFIPNEARGVTVIYRGIIEPTCTREYCIVKLNMGFNNKPYFYILIPDKYDLTLFKIFGEVANTTECIYAPRDFKCYLVKYEKAILSSYELQLHLHFKEE
jgi:hypothetical protein